MRSATARCSPSRSTRATRDRLNEIKLREGYRPIAPVCRIEDPGRLFNDGLRGPVHALFPARVGSPELRAVTHVDGSARVQTVTRARNAALHELLGAFASRRGAGVLCNTSLNFKGLGFINRMSDLTSTASRVASSAWSWATCGSSAGAPRLSQGNGRRWRPGARPPRRSDRPRARHRRPGVRAWRGRLRVGRRGHRSGMLEVRHRAGGRVGLRHGGRRRLGDRRGRRLWHDHRPGYRGRHGGRLGRLLELHMGLVPGCCRPVTRQPAAN